MALPTKALPTDTVTIDGTPVPIHSLTRAEALHLNTGFREGTMEENVDGAEVYILVHGADVTEEEARAFRNANDPDTAGLLIDGILELSSLAKPSPDGQDADPK